MVEPDVTLAKVTQRASSDAGLAPTCRKTAAPGVPTKRPTQPRDLIWLIGIAVEIQANELKRPIEVDKASVVIHGRPVTLIAHLTVPLKIVAPQGPESREGPLPHLEPADLAPGQPVVLEPPNVGRQVHPTPAGVPNGRGRGLFLAPALGQDKVTVTQGGTA